MRMNVLCFQFKIHLYKIYTHVKCKGYKTISRQLHVCQTPSANIIYKTNSQRLRM